MMDYTFRGVREDNGEWIYGDLVRINGNYYIHPIAGDYCKGEKVIPESLGIWVGIFSDNKKVFTGDLVKCTNKVGTIHYTGEIIFKGGAFMVKTFIVTACGGYYKERMFKDCANIEVVGNIFDNSVVPVK